MQLMYLSGAINKTVSQTAPDWVGWMMSPKMGNRVPDDGRLIGFDNGCFGDQFSPRRWRLFLLKHYPLRSRALFVVVPDVVGDAEATLGRWHEYSATARLYKMPLAFVGQDGLRPEMVPWDEFECFFIGGSDNWKWPDGEITPCVRALIDAAKDRGKWVHAGRVNSGKRFAMCAAAGIDSGDGTYLTRGPNVNLPRLLKWRA
jgi:hypothetical protein